MRLTRPITPPMVRPARVCTRRELYIEGNAKHSPNSAESWTRSENAALWPTPWWCDTAVVSFQRHDNSTTFARHTVLARVNTIAPSGARKTRHFSRTFDGITLAAAIFDTVDCCTAHARAVRFLPSSLSYRALSWRHVFDFLEICNQFHTDAWLFALLNFFLSMNYLLSVSFALIDTTFDNHR